MSIQRVIIRVIVTGSSNSGSISLSLEDLF